MLEKILGIIIGNWPVEIAIVAAILLVIRDRRKTRSKKPSRFLDGAFSITGIVTIVIFVLMLLFFIFMALIMSDK